MFERSSGKTRLVGLGPGRLRKRRLAELRTQTSLLKSTGKRTRVGCRRVRRNEERKCVVFKNEVNHYGNEDMKNMVDPRTTLKEMREEKNKDSRINVKCLHHEKMILGDKGWE